MKLSDFRKLIGAVHARGLASIEPVEATLAKAMTPAEYFAYYAIKMTKNDLDDRIERASYMVESLWHPENDGYAEAEAVHTALSDHMELIDAILAGVDLDNWDDPLTPDTVDMEIELDETTEAIQE